MMNNISNITKQKRITKQLKIEFQKELDEILVWWNTNMIDLENGGFYGRIDGESQKFPKADKGVILNTRLLWTYATMSNNSNCLELANRAYHFLCNYFWDDLNSGVFWSVDYKGNPINTQKQIYAQAFTIYALSEYYLLTKDESAIHRATEIFWLIEKYSQDKEKEGYLNAFDRDWTPMNDIRLSEKDANEAKIMNTHLHVLEAYTNFYKASPSTVLGDALKSCLNLFLEKFYILENGSMHVYFDEDWIPKSNHISFGHNIEASWLIWEAATILKDEKLQTKARPIIAHMADAVLQNGVAEDGSVWYEGNETTITDTDRHWWVQAEAVVGFWNAAIVTGDEKFKTASINCFRYIQNTIKDKKNGEWFWKVDKDGKPDFKEDKAGPWKAPYHNARMCIKMLELLDET